MVDKQTDSKGLDIEGFVASLCFARVVTRFLTLLLRCALFLSVKKKHCPCIFV